MLQENMCNRVLVGSVTLLRAVLKAWMMRMQVSSPGSGPAKQYTAPPAGDADIITCGPSHPRWRTSGPEALVQSHPMRPHGGW